jgi:hypothetical protein
MGRRVSVIVQDRQDGYFRELLFLFTGLLLKLKMWVPSVFRSRRSFASLPLSKHLANPVSMIAGLF